MLWLIKRIFPGTLLHGSGTISPERPGLDQAADRAITRGRQILGQAHQQTPQQAAGRLSP